MLLKRVASGPGSWGTCSLSCSLSLSYVTQTCSADSGRTLLALKRSNEQQFDTSWQFFCPPSFFVRTKRQDYTPNTGNEKAMDFKLNVCHTVLQKDLDVKNPDDIAAWGKKIKGTSLGYVFFLRLDLQKSNHAQ